MFLRLTSFAASLVALAVVLLAGSLSAQDTVGVRLGLVYQAEYQPGLVVLPVGVPRGQEQLASLVGTILQQDLNFSDRLEVRSGGAVAAGQPVNRALWKERGADWVLAGNIEPRGAGAELHLVLHDAVYDRVKAEQRFQLPHPGDPNFRMAVHAASDRVVEWATGSPGMAATRIAFVREGRGSKEIYLVDSDGENVQRVTSDGSITLSPAWSPDGTRIAYTSFRAGTPALYERDLRSGRDRLISSREGLNITPGYSPDGRLIAFGTTVRGNTEVATKDIQQDCCLEQQTQGRHFDSLSPTFAPDGERFAFVSNRLGEPHIYVMPLGGEPRLLSDYSYGGRGYNTSPDWSPRGPQVAYHSRINGSHQLMVVNAETGGRRLLTNVGSNEDPSWAPDGRHVVFSSTDRDGGGLFVLDTVSGRIRPLLRGGGYGLPDWSPALREAPRSGASSGTR